MENPQLQAQDLINSLLQQIADTAAASARAIAERDAYIRQLQAQVEHQADVQAPQNPS